MKTCEHAGIRAMHREQELAVVRKILSPNGSDHPAEATGVLVGRFDRLKGDILPSGVQLHLIDRSPVAE
jgi:hypothetical protein